MRLMKFSEFTRRRFIAGVAGAPLVATTRQEAPPNRPLVVTSKTNSLVREEITTTAWDILAAGGSAMDAAEKATNVSERDPRDKTVGYGGDPNEDGYHQLDAYAIAYGLNAMIDGLWLAMMMEPKNFDREAAKRACRNYLASVFPAEFAAVSPSAASPRRVS